MGTCEALLGDTPKKTEKILPGDWKRTIKTQRM
jgi:hypothetical protein